MADDITPTPKPVFSSTSVTMDVVVVQDTWEARALQRLRQIRHDWLRQKRCVLVVLDVDGFMNIYQCEPNGRITTS